MSKWQIFLVIIIGSITLVSVYSGKVNRIYNSVEWKLYFKDGYNGKNVKIMTGKNKCKDFLLLNNFDVEGEVTLKDMSTDGKIAVVVKTRSDDNHLYVVDQGGKVLYHHILGQDSRCSFVKFSNKGDKVVYYLRRSRDLNILTLETGEKSNINNIEGLNPTSCDWNKEDSKLLFGFFYTTNSIYLYDINKREFLNIYEGRELTGRSYAKTTTIVSPIFLNSFEVIFFDRDNSSVWRLNYQSGEKSLFYNGKKTRGCLLTYYDTELSGIWDITPDGKYLICSRWRAFHWGLETINIVLIDIETKKKYSLYTYAAGLKYFTIR
ncbi:hypothetical protein KAU32_08375 [bacterium]|nr:hypothetical protein [bacterium]